MGGFGLPFVFQKQMVCFPGHIIRFRKGGLFILMRVLCQSPLQSLE